jgi:MFS family permease
MLGTVHGLRRVGGLLGRADFLAIWGAGVFESVVRWTELLVVGVYTQQVTGSPFLVAAMMFANLVPSALFGTFTGAFAERVDRRVLLLGGLAFMAGLAAAMGTVAAAGGLELWHVAVATFLNGAAWTAEYPVRRTLLGEIAGPGNSATGMTFDIATGTSMMFLGPILGGFLMRDVGIQGFYFVAAACFAGAFLCVLAIRFKPEAAVVTRDRLRQVIADGFRHLRRNPPVAGVLVVTLLLNFFGFSFVSMLPVIGAEKLLLGPVLTGVLMSMEGAGALIGLLLLTIYAAPRYYMRLLVGGAVSLLVAITVFSTLPWLSPALLVLLVGGVGEAGFLSMQATILFEATPTKMRRRVMGLLVATFGAGPLGMLHTGALAEWLGADVAIGIVAFEGLVALALCLWRWPALRKASIEAPAVL